MSTPTANSPAKSPYSHSKAWDREAAALQERVLANLERQQQIIGRLSRDTSASGIRETSSYRSNVSAGLTPPPARHQPSARSPLRARASPTRLESVSRSFTSDQMDVDYATISAREMRALIQDDIVLARLKNQLAQAQQIKKDSEKKASTIAELRHQLHTLSKEKEEVYALRAKLASVDEKARLQKAELCYKQGEQEERMKRFEENEEALRQQLVHTEDVRLQQARQLRAQIAQLEEQLSEAKARSEKHDKDRRVAEAQLGKMEAVEEQRRNLMETVSKLERQVATLEANNRAMEAQLHDAEDRASRERGSRETLERQEDDFRSEVTRLREENKVIPRLQQEADMVPQLRTSLSRANDTVEQLRAELEKERTCHQNAESSLRSSERSIAMLETQLQDALSRQSQLDDDRRRTEEERSRLDVLLKAEQDEHRRAVQEKKAHSDFLSRELDSARATMDALREQLAEWKSRAGEERVRHESHTTAICEAVYAVQRVVDAAVASGTMTSSGDLSEFTSLADADHHAFTTLMTSLARLIEEYGAARDRHVELVADHDATCTQLRTLRQEEANVRSEFTLLQGELAEERKRRTHVAEEKADVDSQLLKAETRVADLLEDMRARDEYIRQLISHLRASFPAELSGGLPSSPDRSFSPSRQRPTTAAAWPSMKTQLGDCVDRVLSELTNTMREWRKVCDELRQTQEELEDSQAQSQDRQSTIGGLRQDLADMKKRFEGRDRQATELEARVRTQDETIEDMRAWEGRAMELQDANRNLRSELEAMNETQAKTFAALRLVIRFVRPCDRKVRALIQQKVVLLAMLRNVERSQKENIELLRAMSAEMGATSEDGPFAPMKTMLARPRTTSFRAAAIAVLAARRLWGMRGQGTFGTSVRIGGTVLHFAADASVGDDTHLPDVRSFGLPHAPPSPPHGYVRAGPVDTPEGIGEALLRVLSHLDCRRPGSHTRRSSPSRLDASAMSSWVGNLYTGGVWPSPAARRGSGADSPPSSPPLAGLSLQRSLLDQLLAGSNQFRWAVVQRQSRSGDSNKRGAASLGVSAYDANSLMSSIRRISLECVRALRDADHDKKKLQTECYNLIDACSREQEHATNLQEMLKRSEDAVKFLEGRLSSTQKEMEEMVHWHKHEELAKQHAELLDKHTKLEAQQEEVLTRLEDTEAELRKLHSQLQTTLIELDEKTAMNTEMHKTLLEREESLNSLQDLVKKKTQDHVVQDTTLKNAQKDLAETRASLMEATRDNKTLQSKVRSLEDELSEARKKVATMEISFSDATNRLKDTEARRSEALFASERKTQELNSTQTMVKKLSEAYQMAMQHSAEVDKELQASRRHIIELRMELKAALARNEKAASDKQQWARAKQKLVDLHSAVETDLSRTIGGPDDKKDVLSEQMALNQYVDRLERTLAQDGGASGAQPSAGLGRSSRDASPARRDDWRDYRSLAQTLSRDMARAEEIRDNHTSGFAHLRESIDYLRPSAMGSTPTAPLSPRPGLNSSVGHISTPGRYATSPMRDAHGQGASRTPAGGDLTRGRYSDRF